MTVFDEFTSDCAVLLDLDGTIIDSRHGIVSTLHHVIETLGHIPDRSRDLTWVVGPPLAELMAEVLSAYGETRVEEGVALYRERYQAVGRHQTPPYPGMVDLLHRLAASPLRLYTATSKPAFLARDILIEHGLDGLFEQVCGACDDESGGEKPEMIARIMKDHDIQPGNAIMVGDRRFDIVGAHANRLRGIGVLWGYGGESELTEAGADHLCVSPADLELAIANQLRAAMKHHHAA